MSLAGRRVVVTRAAGQADDLAELIAAAGGTPVVVPLIEIVDQPVSWPALGAYGWIVVTSPNGAVRLPGLPAGPRLAAVGTRTAAALARPADLLPRRQSAAGLLAEFPGGPGRVLVVQAGGAAPTLVDGLRAAGWTVDVVQPYRSVARRPSAPERAAAGAADVLLLASASAATAWAASFGRSTPPVVVAIGPECARAAAAAGLPVTAVAADHSLTGLLAAAEAALRAPGDSPPRP